MNLNDNIEAGLAALARRDLETAENCFQAVLAMDPDDAQAHYSLAQIHAASGRLDQARDAALRAVQNGASIDGLLFLANLAGSRSDWDEGEKWLAQLLALKPGHREAWILRSKFATANGDPVRGGDYLRAAVDTSPADFALLHRYVAYRTANGLAEELAPLEKFIALNRDSPEFLSQALWLLLPHREGRLRRERGLWLMHAADMDELHFKFAQRELAEFRAAAGAWVEAAPDAKGAATMYALSCLAAGDRAAAAVAFDRLGGILHPGHILACVHLDAAFFAATADLADETIALTLPKVEMIIGDIPHGERVIFASCDIVYFRTYGWQLLDSLSRHPRVPVHLHIFDVTEQESATLTPMLAAAAGPLPLSVSREWSGLRDGAAAGAKGYYHSIRFIRLYQFLRDYSTDAWAVDIDLTFNATPLPLFDRLQNHDVSLMASPGRMEPNNQINASLVGVRATPEGLAFLRRVAGYIAYYLRAGRLPWGIDQLALFAAFVQSAGADSPLKVSTVIPDFIGAPAA